MSQNDSFEDKIRQQLESYEVPYDKVYWKHYTRRFPINRLAFWQRWYVPYLFSLLLFGGLFGWLQYEKKPAPQIVTNARHIDTILVEKTIYVRDTLVMRDTVYYLPQSSGTASSRKKMSKQTALLDDKTSDLSQADERQLALDEWFESPNTPSKAPTTSTTAFKESENSQNPIQTKVYAINAKENGVEAGLQEDTAAKLTVNQSLALTATDTAANGQLTTGHESSEIDEEAAEISTPERQFFVSAGPRISLFSPWSTGNLDAYGGLFAGGQISLEWKRLQLSTGLQYGAMLHEFDEISAITAGQRSNFPKINQLSPAPEGISILSQQLMIPLQLHYTAFERGQWRASIGLGVLSNLLLREHFIYDINNQENELWNRALGQRQRLEIAHLQIGGGISYQLNQQLELQAQLYYNQALRYLGVAQTNSQGPSLQLGLNWLLTR